MPNRPASPSSCTWPSPLPHDFLAVPACAYPPKPGLKGGLQWVAGNEDGYEASQHGYGAERAAASGVEGTFSKDTYIHPDNEGNQ